MVRIFEFRVKLIQDVGLRGRTRAPITGRRDNRPLFPEVGCAFFFFVRATFAVLKVGLLFGFAHEFP